MGLSILIGLFIYELQAVKCIQRNVKASTLENWPWWKLLLCISVQKQHKDLLNSNEVIVTTFTTPKHQNEDEDGDAVLRHVAAYVDDVTSL